MKLLARYAETLSKYLRYELTVVDVGGTSSHTCLPRGSEEFHGLHEPFRTDYAYEFRIDICEPGRKGQRQ